MGGYREPLEVHCTRTPLLVVRLLTCCASFAPLSFRLGGLRQNLVRGALADDEASRQLRNGDPFGAAHLEHLVVPACPALPLEPVSIAVGIRIVLAPG